jgi:hypothetical protein
MTNLVIHGGAEALPRTEMTAKRAAEFHAALTDAVMRDPPELRPFAKRADGRLLAGRKYPA